MEKGIANLERHVNNVRNHYGLPCVVSVNHFTADTPRSTSCSRRRWRSWRCRWCSRATGPRAARARPTWRARWSRSCEHGKSEFRFVYDEKQTLWDKIKTDRDEDLRRRRHLRRCEDQARRSTSCRRTATGIIPVCIAKTQYSFSTDPAARGAPSGHIVNMREVRLAAGAEFIVMVCGDVMTMPGLPKVPSADKIDIDAEGRVVGLF